LTLSPLVDAPIPNDAKPECHGGSSFGNGTWLMESDEEADGAYYLNREGRKRHEEFHKAGYLDGIAAGRNDAAQDGFD
ncbi:hypothetical protein SOVF_146510, partial [Spinacia oleracea]